MVDTPQRSAGNGPEKAGAEVAARLSRLVRDLVWELHPHMQRMVAVTLDSDLDRDLSRRRYGLGGLLHEAPNGDNGNLAISRIQHRANASVGSLVCGGLSHAG